MITHGEIELDNHDEGRCYGGFGGFSGIDFDCECPGFIR